MPKAIPAQLPRIKVGDTLPRRTGRCAVSLFDVGVAFEADGVGRHVAAHDPNVPFDLGGAEASATVPAWTSLMKCALFFRQGIQTLTKGN